MPPQHNFPGRVEVGPNGPKEHVAHDYWAEQVGGVRSLVSFVQNTLQKKPRFYSYKLNSFSFPIRSPYFIQSIKSDRGGGEEEEQVGK